MVGLWSVFSNPCLNLGRVSPCIALTTLRRTKRSLWSATLIACILLPMAATTLAIAGGELDRVVASVQKRYTKIGHISPHELLLQMRAGADLVLIDTREAEEYAVSHLARAERLDPNAWVWAFKERFGHRVAGKTVVFYCSVGERSSRMAEHVLDAARAGGAREVLNLAGGIFAWHNAQLPLSSAAGPTDHVHPYDGEWGRLVERKALRRLRPQTPPAQ